MRAGDARRRDRLLDVAARHPRRARRARRAVEPRRARGARRARGGARASSAAASIEFIPRTFLDGYDDADRELICAMAARLGPAGAPQHAHARCRTRPTAGSAASSSREAAHARRPRAPPDVRDQPAGRPLLARHDVPVRRDAELPRHAHAAVARARARGCATPRVREQMRAELADPTGRSFVFVVAGAARRAVHPARARAVARPQRRRDRRRSWASTRSTRSSTSRSPSDLETQFVLAAPPTPTRRRRDRDA